LDWKPRIVVTLNRNDLVCGQTEEELASLKFTRACVRKRSGGLRGAGSEPLDDRFVACAEWRFVAGHCRPAASLVGPLYGP